MILTILSAAGLLLSTIAIVELFTTNNIKIDSISKIGIVVPLALASILLSIGSLYSNSKPKEETKEDTSSSKTNEVIIEIPNNFETGIITDEEGNRYYVSKMKEGEDSSNEEGVYSS